MGVVLVIWRPGVRPWSLHGLSMVSPWNLHGISIESPWRKHRLRSDEDPYIYTRCSESEGLSLRSESLKHQIKERIEDGGYPARSTAEGVGGFRSSCTATVCGKKLAMHHTLLLYVFAELNMCLYLSNYICA